MAEFLDVFYLRQKAMTQILAGAVDQPNLEPEKGVLGNNISALFAHSEDTIYVKNLGSKTGLDLDYHMEMRPKELVVSFKKEGQVKAFRWVYEDNRLSLNHQEVAGHMRELFKKWMFQIVQDIQHNRAEVTEYCKQPWGTQK